MYDVEFRDVAAELKEKVEERWSFMVDCSVVEVDGVLEAVVVEVVLTVF